jgi:hypothetical protein
VEKNSRIIIEEEIIILLVEVQMQTSNFKNSQSSKKIFISQEEPKGPASRILIATMICQGFASSIGYEMAPAGEPRESVEFAYLMADEIIRQGDLK